jgi:hypothetical protein
MTGRDAIVGPMVLGSQSSVSGLYAAMTFHHARLETSGRHVLSTLHLEGRAAAQRSFDAFRRELEAHLEAEERWVLPAFARVEPNASEDILTEHGQIREAAGAAERSFDDRTDGPGKAPDERPMHELLELLCEHCRREESNLYRWSETAIGEPESRAVLQKIEAAERGDDDAAESRAGDDLGRARTIPRSGRRRASE